MSTFLTDERSSSEHPLLVLCVDDEENILNALTRLFRGEPFQLLAARSGQAGLELLRSTVGICLIISDQQMPEMTGTDFLEAARALAPDIPRMILTGYADASAAIAAINEGGAFRYLIKPWNENELLLAVRDGVQRYLLHQENLQLNEMVQLQKKELDEWNMNLRNKVLQQTGIIRNKLKEAHQQHVCSRIDSDTVVQMFAKMQGLRNPRLCQHSRTVALLAASMAKTLGLPHEQTEEIRNAALLHDIGLLCMPDHVLALKPQQIRAEHTAEYRSHAVKGQAVMEPFEVLQGVGRLIRHHHEEYTGGGFPDGLAGWQIPLGSQLIHIANFIDDAYSPEQGIKAKYQLTQKLAAVMGRYFDPALATTAYLAVNEPLMITPFR